MSNTTDMDILNRPEITEKRIMEIKNIIAENPEKNRTQISRLICIAWGWQSANGYLKEISCRDMLRELDKSGSIKLPPPMSTPRIKGKRSSILHLEHDMKPIECRLKEQLPLKVQIVEGREMTLEFKSYIDQFHYLHFDRTIGENMKYQVYGRDGATLACMLFGSAAWSCAGRDKYIGWYKEQREKNLMNITANTRFLIFPWVHIPCLASHLLSVISKRISNDWEMKYGHPVYCLETYVEIGRFRGTSYKSANWVHVGKTSGRGRNGGHHNAILPEKDVYLLPLCKEFRKKLGGALC